MRGETAWSGHEQTMELGSWVFHMAAYYRGRLTQEQVHCDLASVFCILISLGGILEEINPPLLLLF